MTGLIARWRAAAMTAGADDPGAVDAAGVELLDRWREPHRHYHTVTHLSAVLDVIDRHASIAPRPDLVRLAAWCHDAVYDPRAPGDRNERDSAALADALLTPLGLPAAEVTEVSRLVLLTAGHVVDPGDPDGGLLCDADLAVLAAPAAEYDTYSAAIRREYAHVPEPDYRPARARVLSALLAQPTLYHHPTLAARWTQPAHTNLTRELTRLSP